MSSDRPTAGLTPAEILARMPYDRPMRFVDRIDEVDQEHILAAYTWTEEDCEGHFRNDPVVPGVKLIELGAQAGIVAWGIYQASLTVPPEKLEGLVTLFTHLDEVRFRHMVRPGDTTLCHATFGTAGFFRRMRMKAEVRIDLAEGEGAGKTVLTGLFAGLALPGSRLGDLG